MIKVLKRPTITLKELSVNYEDTIEDTAADEYAGDMGRYPYIQIGNFVIQTTDTTKIVLHNDQFLPKIEVYFKDPTWKFIDPLYPLDNEIISLFIQSNSEMLMPIRMDFKIIEFNTIKDDRDVDYVLTGLLNVDFLYFRETLAIQDTSFNTLKKIADKSELGFASNIDDTDDSMTWINTRERDTISNFIQDIVDHSYKNDDTFMLSYIDFYYNLNYVDIETALNEDISELKGMLHTSNYHKSNEEVDDYLFLTDHPDKMNSSNYIKKFNLINQTTRINLEIGYREHTSYYDKSDNVKYEFKIESISKSGIDNNVILKDKIDKTNFYNNLSTSEYYGVIDTDNVHPNYFYAYSLNKQNLEFLQKIRIKVVIGALNFNLYRFQKIDMSFYKMKELNLNKDNYLNDDSKEYDQDKLNQRLSGEWLITAINYTFTKHSGFQQEVTLVKRELGFNNESDF